MKSLGDCALCNHTFSRQGISRHLVSCIKSNALEEKGTDCLHLFVEATYEKYYWLHLLIKKKATLYHLDSYLRDIWLECCNHLSAFTIHSEIYSSGESYGMDTKSLNVRIGSVLAPLEKCDYEYDFGSTTDLTIKVLGERPGIIDQDIFLLARNNPPLISCSYCDRPATLICTSCIYSGDACFCDECLEEHPCEEDCSLPLVNSPRTGVCGYC